MPDRKRFSVDVFPKLRLSWKRKSWKFWSPPTNDIPLRNMRCALGRQKYTDGFLEMSILFWLPKKKICILKEHFKQRGVARIFGPAECKTKARGRAVSSNRQRRIFCEKPWLIGFEFSNLRAPLDRVCRFYLHQGRPLTKRLWVGRKPRQIKS